MKLDDLFYVTILADRMSAKIHCTKAYQTLQEPILEKQIVQFLTSKKIVYGIDEKIASTIAQKIDADQFPLTIASGTMPVHGEDGYITYTFDRISERAKDGSSDFRDIMQIPTVHENEPIAVETLPTKGTHGKDIFGSAVLPRSGKKQRLILGRNVRYDEHLHTYFSMVEGQVSVRERKIDVHNVFSVHETLSMKTGNVNFIGSVEIHGDVPTGYSIIAGGDIRVFGLVEGATLQAAGSIYISEGFAGMQKGKVTAKGDVYVSYVNQGVIHAEQSIYVENAILHSMCYANDSIVCKRGHVIGGSLKAGSHIQAYEIGNRLHTRTVVAIEHGVTTTDEEIRLREQLSIIHKKIDQLTLIGDKLKQANLLTNEEMNQTRLRHKNSLEQMQRKQAKLNKKITTFEQRQSESGHGIITIQHTLHANVTISIGKYERLIQKERTRIKCFMEKNEIQILSL